jgi:uncharacterized protein
MEFHFRSLKSKSNPELIFSRSISCEHVWQERADVKEGSAVDCHITVQMMDSIATMTGTLKATVTMLCARCLQPFSLGLETSCNETFFDPEEHPELEEDANVHAVVDDVIELSSHIEDNILLSLPYVALCNDECKGLCPTCGGNLNVKSCGCQRESIDPRLAALSKWFTPETSDSSE